MPGKALLEMESPAALRFEADVPEALIDHVKLGDPLNIQLNAGTDLLAAKVAEIAPVADPASRTFLVKLDLPHEDGVRAGQFGRVRVPIGMSETPLVPAAAITTHGQMEYVSVVSEGRAHQRIVRTGKWLKGEVELLSGVDEGEAVVVKGTPQDSQRVEVKP